jgi:hypothetical protein
MEYRFNSGKGQGGRGFFRRRLRCPAKPATASLAANSTRFLFPTARLLFPQGQADFETQLGVVFQIL